MRDRRRRTTTTVEDRIAQLTLKIERVGATEGPLATVAIATRYTITNKRTRRILLRLLVPGATTEDARRHGRRLVLMVAEAWHGLLL